MVLSSDMLYYPNGIFVDSNFDLYVADGFNNRIQLFRQDEVNGITVAGNGSINITITLYYPSGIVLDADGYIFITDLSNHRIVGSGCKWFSMYRWMFWRWFSISSVKYSTSS